MSGNGKGKGQVAVHIATLRHLVSCADPVGNVSWILFPEGRSSELGLRRGVGQAAHILI